MISHIVKCEEYLRDRHRPWGLAWSLKWRSGLRWEEVAALRPEHLVISERLGVPVLQIHDVAPTVSGRRALRQDDAKNENSIREVNVESIYDEVRAVADYVIERRLHYETKVLPSYRAGYRKGKGSGPDGLPRNHAEKWRFLISGVKGDPAPSSSWADLLKEMQEQTILPLGVTAHTLRHFSTSLALSSGARTAVVAATHGHTEKTLIDTYSDPLKEELLQLPEMQRRRILELLAQEAEAS